MDDVAPSSMNTVLLLACGILAAALLSKIARRSVFAAPVMFLVAGFAAGAAGVVRETPRSPLVQHVAELALFSVLFTDGMKIRLRRLWSIRRLPARALVLGMPLTLLGTAALAHVVTGAPWIQALLLGAVLSPTDPVFAAAIVGREEVPRRLREMLNIESGLNDGFALPFVTGLLAVSTGRPVSPAALLGELALGVALGVAVPIVAAIAAQVPALEAVPPYRPLYAFSIGLLVLALASIAGGNIYLGAFAAGVTLATVQPEAPVAFRPFGEPLTEVLKLAAVLVFGALLSPHLLWDLGATGYLFAALVLVLVRPVALGLSLVGTGLPHRERVTALWFGPKGFASVIFSLVVLQSHVPGGERLFHLAALAVAASILAHSSTDVVLARLFAKPGPADRQ